MTKRTAPVKPVELTVRQRAFAAAYAKHGNAEKAAKEAGYSARSARQNGSRMLTNADIKAEVGRLVGGALKKAEVTVERIVDEFALAGFADLTDFVEWGPEGVKLKPSKELDVAKRRSIVEVSEGQYGIKIKLAGKIEALNSLAKYQGMFVDKHELSVPNATIVLNLDGKSGNGGR